MQPCVATGQSCKFLNRPLSKITSSNVFYRQPFSISYRSVPFNLSEKWTISTKVKKIMKGLSKIPRTDGPGFKSISYVNFVGANIKKNVLLSLSFLFLPTSTVKTSTIDCYNINDIYVLIKKCIYFHCWQRNYYTSYYSCSQSQEYF